MIAFGVALVAVVLCAVTGYLVGARRGRDARFALEEERARLAASVQAEMARAEAKERERDLSLEKLERAQKEASLAQTAVAVAEKEAGRVETALRERDESARQCERLKKELTEVTTRLALAEKDASRVAESERERAECARNLERVRGELRGVEASLALAQKEALRGEEAERALRAVVAREQSRADESGQAEVKAMLRDVLGPMLDRDRVGQELAQLEGGTSLGQLPSILDAIVKKGGFSTIVLSDDCGLPLAASSSATDVDVLAATSTTLLTLVDRAVSAGRPKPTALVVQDESSQMVLHRVFTAGATRFLLSAVSRGLYLTPGALDPALGKIELALTSRDIYS